MSLYLVWIPAVAVAHALALALLLYALEQISGLLSKLFSRCARDDYEDVQRHQPDSDGQETGGKKPAQAGEELVTAAEISWRDVGCSVLSPDRVTQKRVLYACFGRVEPGQCCGLMGPSGAGKTTLLNILARRKTGKRVEGTLLMNGQPLGQSFQRLSAYVTQEDVFVAMLSAHETLQFYAALTVPSSVTAKERENRIQSVLAILGLQRVQNTKVGGVLPGGIVVRGLSGGEKRRLSIACSLISQPSILFLDEPTTGLDSFAALNVITHMAALAGLGHTIVASIHQPRPAIFDRFDRICLLSEGRQLYYGPPAKAAEWFASLEYMYEPRRDGGLSDWLMDLVSIGFLKPKATARTMTRMEDVEQAATAFKDLNRECNGPEIIPPTMSTSLHCDGAVALTVRKDDTAACCCIPSRQKRRYVSSWQRQFAVLSRRSFIEQLRNPTDTASRIFMGCWIGILTGLVFYNLKDNPSSSQGRISVLFFLLLAQQLLPFTFMNFIVANRRFFIADVAAGIYAPSAYYLAHSLAAFPFVLVNSILGTLAAYGLAGLRNSTSAIILNSLFAALQSLTSTQLLIACVWLTPNQDLAYVMATGYVTFTILLSGFYLRIADISIGFLRAISWAAYTKYALFGVARLELEGITWSANECTASTHGTAVSASVTASGDCSQSGSSILQFWGYTYPIYIMFLALIGFLILMHLISYLALSKLYRTQS